MPSTTETSASALASIERSAKTLRGTLYRWLLDQGEIGATDEEMQIALSMNPSTQRPRRGELAEDGLVRESGDTRKTRSGRPAVVWVAVLNPEQERLF